MRTTETEVRKFNSAARKVEKLIGSLATEHVTNQTVIAAIDRLYRIADEPELRYDVSFTSRIEALIAARITANEQGAEYRRGVRLARCHKTPTVKMDGWNLELALMRVSR